MLVVIGALASSLLAVGAALDGSYVVAGIMGVLAGLLCLRAVNECAAAGHAIGCALEACGIAASDTEIADVESGHALDADDSPSVRPDDRRPLSVQPLFDGVEDRQTRRSG